MLRQFDVCIFRLQGNHELYSTNQRAKLSISKRASERKIYTPIKYRLPTFFGYTLKENKAIRDLFQTLINHSSKTQLLNQLKSCRLPDVKSGNCTVLHWQCTQRIICSKAQAGFLVRVGQQKPRWTRLHLFLQNEFSQGMAKILPGRAGLPGPRPGYASVIC